MNKFGNKKLFSDEVGVEGYAKKNRPIKSMSWRLCVKRSAITHGKKEFLKKLKFVGKC
jgi:hypothetical protein